MNMLDRSGRFIATVVLIITANMSPVAAQFKDQLVQAPKLLAPERGSIGGAFAGIGFAATELARGSFRVPIPMSVPQERGLLQVNIVPIYAPDRGISEWGMGWSADLSITRHRLVGEIDYANDELVSPWGRLRSGDDGNLYPSGLSATVRIVASGSDWIATTAAGTQFRFTSSSGVVTPRGIYAWQLTEVISILGDRTSLEWTKNTSGRPFLTRVSWGGRGTVAQYELRQVYESLAMGFVDHATGTELDRRVTSLVLFVRDPSSGVLRERGRYQISYRAAPFGPAFYLETVRRVFAGGAAQPATTFHYELDETQLPIAALEHYTGLDNVFQVLGDTAIQADHAVPEDMNNDGRTDFEHAAQLTQIQHTDTGWVQSALPMPDGSEPRCRPVPSDSNQPRVLARLTADVGESHVLFIRKVSTAPVTSAILICDRVGRSLAELMIPDDWTLGPNTRLVDVDRDRRPDIVRVSRAGVEVLHNDSDMQSFRFTPLPRFEWSLDLTPKVTWLNDFDGDGNVDVALRANTGLWILFGLGSNRWTSSPQLFRFVTTTGSILSSVDTFQLTFVDANKDGLTDVILTRGISVFLFTNRGDSFAEVPVDGFRNVQSGFGLPVVADVTGRGNIEVGFPAFGTMHVVELAGPSTGLLSSVDDGMGTIARFHYGRSAPSVGVEQRITLLDQLTVESSGYDAVTYNYSYGAPVLHTLGRQLVGFESVSKRSPVSTETIAFVNDDDVAGVARSSEQLDERTPGLVQFTNQIYEDATFHGLRWLRAATMETGHRTIDGLATLSTTTEYATYERDLCPTVTVSFSSNGQLVTTSTLASVANLPNDLSCLSRSISLAGTHTDSTLDFLHVVSLDRNDLGQITRITQYGSQADLLVLQDIAYDKDHRLRTIGAPGRGASVYGFDPQGRLETITDPHGISTRASKLDPLTDAVRELVTDRPQAVSTTLFRYDDRERLQASWDDFSGTSSGQPGTSYTYQDATNTTPGRIDTNILADVVARISRSAVDLLAADGKTLVSGTRIGGHYRLGSTAIDTRSALSTHSSFVGPMTGEALATLTSVELRAAGTLLSEVFHAGFGHEARVTRTVQAGVVGTTTTELQLDGGELVTRTLHPGGAISEFAADAAGNLVRRTDENGVASRYAYDALGRLVHIDTPDGSHVLRFDGFGRAMRVSRDGIGAINFTYDPLTGLPASKQRLDGAGTLVDASVTTYDAFGRVIQVSQATSHDSVVLRFDYDGRVDGSIIGGQLGRLTHVRGDGWQRSTLFDPLGRSYEQHTTLTGWREVAHDKVYRADSSVMSETVTIHDAAGVVKFNVNKETVLDNSGRLSMLKVDNQVLYTLSYDDEGRLARADFVSGDVIVFDFDAVTHRRRGYHVETQALTGGVQSEFDQRGLVAAETYEYDGAEVRRAYSYDGRGSLTRAATPTEIQSYSYTPSGLPDSISDMAGSRSGLHTPAGVPSTDGYVWDSAGRVIANDRWVFEYGASGQLTRASRPDRQLTFVYDDANHRLLKRVNGIPVRADVAGGILTEDHFIELVVIGDIVAGVLDNARFVALMTDPRGTPFGGLDDALGLATPYGVRNSRLGVSEVIDYARLGRDPDLGVIRMGVRDYDPRLGQFWTPDPLYLEDLERCQSSPLQCSLYGYASGNPVSFVDPTGTQAWNGGGQGASPFDTLFSIAAESFVTEMQDPHNWAVAAAAVAVAATAGAALTALPAVSVLGESVAAAEASLALTSVEMTLAQAAATAGGQSVALVTSAGGGAIAASSTAITVPTATVTGGGAGLGAMLPVAGKAAAVGAAASGVNALADSDVVYHYTSQKGAAAIQKDGLWRQASATNVGTYTAQEAVELLGVKTPPEVVLDIRNGGQFVPNKPSIVQPHPLGPGGGVDLTNPRRVPGECVICVRPVKP